VTLNYIFRFKIRIQKLLTLDDSTDEKMKKMLRVF